MNYDITIIGAGIAGLSLANGLAATTDLRIAVIEGVQPVLQWGADSWGTRVSAISQASMQLFQAQKVWPLIVGERVSAYDDMIVWDGEGQGEIHFSGADVGESCLGYIIENRVMQCALWRAMLASSKQITLFCPASWRDIKQDEEAVTITLSDDRVIRSSLLVAADGALSSIREKLRIPFSLRDYGHTAIIANVRCEKSHQKTAWQRFEARGPLALLPFSDEFLCSIVWSQPHEEARALLALDENAFNDEISQRFEYRLGQLCLASQRMAFPLSARHVLDYVSGRVVLLGDAAHTIHPLAGQGLNLGLQDVATLITVVNNALVAGRDFAATDTLRRYERKRKVQAKTLLALMEGFKSLFGTTHPMALLMRNSGLRLCNNQLLARQFFIRRGLSLHES